MTTASAARPTDRDYIVDVDRTDLAGTTAVDFRLDVPVAHHDKLKSTVMVPADGYVENFELRLGLLSQDCYDASELKSLMHSLVEEMDLDLDERGTTTLSLAQPAVSYDPDWGEPGFYHVHFRQGFWTPEWGERAFLSFAGRFTAQFVDAVEWVEPATRTVEVGR